MKKLKLVYFSPTDTTKTIVENVAKGLQLNYESYNITLSQNRIKLPSFEKEDILILGLPVYSGRIPFILSKFLSNLKGNNATAIAIAVYGNRDYDDCLLEMVNLLESSDFNLAGAGAFIGEHSFTKLLATNRPDSKDISIAKTFGTKLKELIDTSNLQNATALTVNGNFPYRQVKPSLPIAPVVNSNCTGCGICLSYCPVDAITLDKTIKTDEDRCIKCHSCVKRCPVNAINFDVRLDNTKNFLVDSFAKKRCEPDLFYNN